MKILNIKYNNPGADYDGVPIRYFHIKLDNNIEVFLNLTQDNLIDNEASWVLYGNRQLYFDEPEDQFTSDVKKLFKIKKFILKKFNMIITFQ